MPKLFIVGDQSEIAQGITPYFRRDGWEIEGWRRGGDLFLRGEKWNLLLVAIGRVDPVGFWGNITFDRFKDCVDSNLIEPYRVLWNMWRYRGAPSSVCFLTGSNPQKPMAGYLPYNASKMALNKMVEQLDFETPDTKFFALAPGFVDTKIHQATKDAKWPNARLEKGLRDNDGTPMEKIYECLRWCEAQSKQVLGGRQLCVSDPWGPMLPAAIADQPNLYKLRRVE